LRVLFVGYRLYIYSVGYEGGEMRGKPLASVAARVDRIAKTGDLSLALEPAAERATRRLAWSLRHDDGHDIEAWYMLGLIHWYRHAALEEGPDGGEQEAAIRALTPCFVTGMDIPEPLLPLVAEAAASAAIEMLQRAVTSPDPAALSEVTELWQRILAATPPDHPRREDYESCLRLALRVRSGQPAEEAVMDGAIEEMREAAKSAPAGTRDRAGALTNLAMILWARYKRSGDPADLDQAVSTGRDAVESAPADDTVRAITLANLATVLEARYERSGDAADLDQAIRAGRDAVESVPADDPGRAVMQSNLGNVLRTRFERSGDQADLQEAISVGRDAVESVPADDPRRAAMLFSLATALEKKYEQSGDPADLEKAISTGGEAIGSTEARDPQRSVRLSGLSMSLRRRFDLTGDVDDLEEAVSTGRDAVNSVPAASPDRGGILANFGAALRVRFEQTGDLTDLEEAISTGRDAVAVTPAGDPQRAGRISNLAAALLARFTRIGSQTDLDGAIGAGRDAVRATWAGHPYRATMLANLGTALESRFERTGEQADLDEAIDVMRSAVDVTSADDALAAWQWSNLGAALLARFTRTGDQADLEEAITIIRKAARAGTAVRPLQAAISSNLGIALRARFERTGDHPDLEEAIAAEQRAVDMISASRPDRASYLSGFGNALLARFDQTGDSTDLDEAISTGRNAADIIPADHPDRAAVLSNLGGAFLRRFGRSADPADLDEAISTGRDAVHATPANQPSRATYLFNLGNALLTRFERTGSPGFVREAISAYADAANTASAPPLIRIQAARAAASLAADTDPSQAAALLDTAVRLLPQTAPRQLSRPDKQYALSGFAFLASEAAALTLQTSGSASRALGLLELGRAVLHSQVLDTRSDLTDLRAHHPDLAARFLELCDQLDPAEDTGPVPSATAADPARIRQVAAPDRRHVAAELAALLDQIRGLDGFETFLLPPQPDQLTCHAHRGPIVVFSISRYRSDAITITPQAITHVRLPDLALDTLRDKIDGFGRALAVATSRKAGDSERSGAQDTLSQILEWLWDSAAEPVLHGLGYQDPADPGTAGPAVWWAPGGLLGQLPLHAAGYHRQPGGCTVIDRVTSSYTPTVRGLGYARDHNTANPAAHSLIVAMPSTPGAPPLPYAASEAQMLQARLPAPTLLIEDPGTPGENCPTKAAVLAHLAEAGIAHFACHARSDPIDPSRSELFLHDHKQHPLTVAGLATIRLDQAQLTYLSACRTSRNASIALLDEAIHLTSAFQLAGFPHVIGTLWQIDDVAAVHVADAFYTHLQTQPSVFDTTKCAQALHYAIRGLRDGLLDTPSRWAAYVHAGA
jgi:CHAT domain/Tetratricopeptide repeat